MVERIRTAGGTAEAVARDLGAPEEAAGGRLRNSTILILHGAKDMGFPVQLAQRLHQAIPTSRLAVVSNAAHLCHFENPEAWSQAIHHFTTAD